MSRLRYCLLVTYAVIAVYAGKLHNLVGKASARFVASRSARSSPWLAGIMPLLTMGMSMRFNRSLSSAFEKCLLPGEPLRFLLESPTIHAGDCVPLEPHLRENNHLMLYAGRTRVVDLAYRDGQLVPRADESYDMVGHGVQLRYACADAGRLAADLRGYLQKVVVRQQFVNGEGHCHAWLSRQFGSRRVAATAWATVDSESVIGFGDSSEKKKFWNPIRRMGRDTLEVLATEPQFGKGVASRPLGNEADLLFWAPQAREFLITEVKDGKSANGVYLSPVQLGCYLAAWRRFAKCEPHSALSGLRALIAQRQRLGLIQGPCQLPETDADLRFRPVIVVQAPNERSTCWKKLEIVRRALERVWQGTEMGVPAQELLAGLSILGANGLLVDITRAHAQWEGRRHDP